MPQPPKLSDEQRRQNLEKAAWVRRQRAQIKEQIKAGSMSLPMLLDQISDQVVAKMRVINALEAIPGVGKIRARKIMERLKISETRRIQGLGQKQKEALLREFSDR